MSAKESIQLGKILWHSCDAIVEDSRGASGGLCTLWNNKEVCLDFSLKASIGFLPNFDLDRTTTSLWLLICIFQSIRWKKLHVGDPF